MDTGPLWTLLKSLLLFTIIIILGLVLYLPMRKYVDSWPIPGITNQGQESSVVHKPRDENNQPEIIDGIHVVTGMAYDENFDVVKATCTSCHSSKLIIQNRATREGWKDMIRWMQATQGLPELGTIEPKVLDYLAKHYAPQNIGRRANLDVDAIEWYVLSAE